MADSSFPGEAGEEESIAIVEEAVIDGPSGERERQNSSPLTHGVKIFGFRLLLATDDFVLPAFIECLTHLLLFVVFSVGLYLFTFNGLAKADLTGADIYLEAYLAASLATYFLNLIIIAFLCRESAEGAIWDTKSRRNVVPLFRASLIVTWVEVMVNIYGTVVCVYLVFFEESSQDERHHRAYVGILVLCCAIWALILIKTLLFLFMVEDFSGFMCGIGRSKDEPSEGLCFKAVAKLCFRENSKHYHYLQEAAGVFGEIFIYDPFVLSDLVAALILLFEKATKQAEAIQAPRTGKEVPAGTGNVESQSPAGLLHDFRSSSDDASALPAMSQPLKRVSPSVMLRYMMYAYSMYGSALYVIDAKKHLKRLCLTMKHPSYCCFLPSSCRRVYVDGDDCCACQTASVKACLPELRDEDFIYMSFRDTALMSPFLVALDHKLQSIVIAIRGSGSIPDLITDFTATPRSIRDVFGPDTDIDRSFEAHSGMLKVAHNIYQMLVVDDSILDMAIAKSDGYSIVVTGHSLGAGIAAILAILLRQRYGSSTCAYCYGPPGGTLNAPACSESRKFDHSVVMSNDLVPRLSFRSICNLKDRMRMVLLKSTVPKYKIIYKDILKKFCCFREGFGNAPQSSSERVSLSNTESSDQASYYGSVWSETATEALMDWPNMYPPGFVRHIRNTSTSRSELLVEMVDVLDPSYFFEFVISPTMFTDHFPQTYVAALEAFRDQELENPMI